MANKRSHTSASRNKESIELKRTNIYHNILKLCSLSLHNNPFHTECKDCDWLLTISIFFSINSFEYSSDSSMDAAAGIMN